MFPLALPSSSPSSIMGVHLPPIVHWGWTAFLMYENAFDKDTCLNLSLGFISLPYFFYMYTHWISALFSQQRWNAANFLDRCSLTSTGDLMADCLGLPLNCWFSGYLQLFLFATGFNLSVASLTCSQLGHWLALPAWLGCIHINAAFPKVKVFQEWSLHNSSARRAQIKILQFW